MLTLLWEKSEGLSVLVDGLLQVELSDDTLVLVISHSVRGENNRIVSQRY